MGADGSGMPSSSRSSTSTGCEGGSVAGHDWTGSAYLYNLDQLASGRPGCSIWFICLQLYALQPYRQRKQRPAAAKRSWVRAAL